MASLPRQDSFAWLPRILSTLPPNQTTNHQAIINTLYVCCAAPCAACRHTQTLQGLHPQAGQATRNASIKEHQSPRVRPGCGVCHFWKQQCTRSCQRKDPRMANGQETGTKIAPLGSHRGRGRGAILSPKRKDHPMQDHAPSPAARTKRRQQARCGHVAVAPHVRVAGWAHSGRAAPTNARSKSRAPPTLVAQEATTTPPD